VTAHARSGLTWRVQRRCGTKIPRSRLLAIGTRHVQSQRQKSSATKLGETSD
jgi:hypothetical protein